MHDEDLSVAYFCGYFAVMLVLEANNFNANKEWEEHMQDHCSWLIVAAVLTHHLLPCQDSLRLPANYLCNFHRESHKAKIPKNS